MKLLILILCLTVSLDAVSFTVDTLHLYSEILSEERTVLVFVPENTPAGKEVPVLYMIDGEFSEHRYSEMMNQSSREMIAVGILNTDRRRDLLALNEAGLFNRFIGEELIPFIKDRFSHSESILYGHSFGGAFCLYSLIKSPGLFNTYLASSPTPIMNMIDPEIYQELDQKLETKCTLHLSYGSRDMRQVRKWAGRLIENLEGTTFNQLTIHFTVFEGENHGSSAVKALENYTVLEIEKE